MKWKHIKEICDKMTEEELEQSALAVSDISSNEIQELKKADCEMFIEEDGKCLLREDEIEEFDYEMYEHYYSEGHFIAHF